MRTRKQGGRGREDRDGLQVVADDLGFGFSLDRGDERSNDD